ncbi:MAG TPA: bifunctional riboflavin kinase/FAD synthetase [Gammaproteobacteria bacterium]|nr:bifunctional riboflavin kinase/FAD synthetase [Gammaproteobacteria bacterium]
MSVVLARRPGLSYYQSTAVAIGNFDGIHLGHQALLEKADSVLTFEPYPQAYFHPERKMPRLTTLREKLKLFKKFGIKAVYAVPFDKKFSLLSPEDFIQTILIKTLGSKKIIVGEDFRFGFHRAGDTNLLNQYITTEVIKPVLCDGSKISSTRVREALFHSDLPLVKKLLGRDYSIIGRVVRGDGRGRQLGFHTANISLLKRLPPLRGVYAVKINNKLKGVANIGSRPTVDGTRDYLETHIFDFNKDIYGDYIEVEFVQKIRDEKKFDSLNALQEQIKLDVQLARDIT